MDRMMQPIKDYLFADQHNYQGDVDARFRDLARQFSRLQDARTDQGGAALVVYFQGQKLSISIPGRSLSLKTGSPIPCHYAIPLAKVYWRH